MSNDFIPFAVGGSANVTPQATYAADTTLTQGGFQSGIAKSPDLNKVWRQSSIMAAVLAQFIVDQSGQNAVDDGTTATLEANLLAAVKNAVKQTVILTDTGAANAYAAANTPALTVLPTTGYVQRVNIAHANTGASTYAPDALTAKPIYGMGLQPLQGGELPVGVVVLMYLVQASVNSGNGAWIIIESLGGALQIPPATASQHAAQLGQMIGVVGSVRNLVMSVPTASTSATLTADEIVVETALGGAPFRLASFSKTINLATTGAGGMDIGTAPVSGFVALYAIYNPTTQTAAMLATNAAILQGNVYGAGHIPAGYTASALVGVWPTNGSGQFVIGSLNDRLLIFFPVNVLNVSGGAASATSLSLAGIVPNNARIIQGGAFSGSTAVSDNALTIESTSTGIGSFTIDNANGGIRVPFQLSLVTAQQLYYSYSATAGTAQASIDVGGYKI